jgi:Domain of unknown function (DUF4136)
MRRVLLAGVTFLMISVSVAFADTKTDYDHSVNFNKYQTFAWKTDKNNDAIVANSIVLSRIQDAATMQLTVRGMSENDQDPDLYLIPHVTARNVQYVDYFPGAGWNDWGWNAWNWNGTVFSYVEGTIILDMVDARTNELVWRSISTKSGDDLIDVQKAKKVNKMMADAFKHFPRWAAIER